MNRRSTRYRSSGGDARAEAEASFEELVGSPGTANSPTEADDFFEWTGEAVIDRKQTDADLFFAELTGEPLAVFQPPAVEQQDEQLHPSRGEAEETAPGSTLSLTVLDDRGQPAPVGTPYRLRVGTAVREGRLLTPGKLVETGLELTGVSQLQLAYGQRTEWQYRSPPAQSRSAGTSAQRTETSSATEASPATPKDITRWDIFVPVSNDDMKKEAVTDIDPLTLPPVEPSWRLDGLAWMSKSQPGHYIARKMARIPTDPVAKFDTRVYFCHPLDHRFYGYPTAAARAPASPPGQAPAAVPGDLARTVEVPLNPAPSQSATKQGKAGGKPWYNQGPSAQVLLLGRDKPATTSDPTFQKLLTAVNKRLVKAWMGELKRNLGNGGDLPKLVDWFGGDEGRNHFKQWCQALGTLGGDRGQSASAHGKGKAIDMNYDHNPWVPLCTTDGRVMNGEDHSRTSLKDNSSGYTNGLEAFRGEFKETPTEAFKTCGRIYDRALRLLVPLVTTTEDPNGIQHFASTYYRIHHDWTPTRVDQNAPPYTAEQVFGFYQMLSWSLRFYFDYAYQRCSVARTDANTYSSHDKPKDPLTSPKNLLAFWQRIEQDWKDERLPSTAELHVTDRNSIPESVRALFDDVELTYSFQSKKETVALFSLQRQMAKVTTDDQRRALGGVVFKQLADDHDRMSRGMVTVAPARRDPCNGVFNHCFEVVMAFCYMLNEPATRKLRAFGAFTGNAGGDMQHFDYGHVTR